MPTNSKLKKTIKTTHKKDVAPILPWYRRFIAAIKTRTDAFLASRPHRSFRLTRRRDYVRELKLPGYFQFTYEVTYTLWHWKRLFLPLILIYVLIYGLLVGIGSQDTYSQITDAVKDAGTDIFGSDWGGLGQSVLTLISVTSNGLSDTMSDAQQIFSVLLGLLAWLTSVWLLRNIISGNKVKMRDGLYSAGAPLIATLLIALLIAVQLLPIALSAVGYAAAVSSGLLNGGVEAMLFWFAAVLLAVLSIYWITSSLFALIIITLPGMYPLRAIKAAGAIVEGRRLRFTLRWLWMILCVILVWVITMVLAISFDTWLKSLWGQIAWLPLVPVVLIVLAGCTIFWISTYVYLLYRKVVDNGTN